MPEFRTLVLAACPKGKCQVREPDTGIASNSRTRGMTCVARARD